MQMDQFGRVEEKPAAPNSHSPLLRVDHPPMGHDTFILHDKHIEVHLFILHMSDRPCKDPVTLQFFYVCPVFQYEPETFQAVHRLAETLPQPDDGI